MLINDFEGDEPRAGEIRRLRITEAHDYDLVGALIDTPPSRRRRRWPMPDLQIAADSGP